MNFIRAVREGRAQEGVLPRGPRSAPSSPASSVRPERIRAVRNASLQALSRYVVPPFEGKVTFFRTKALLAPSVLTRLHYPWSELCRGGVELYDLPCHHWVVLREPHVQVLAEMLEKCLAPREDAAFP